MKKIILLTFCAIIIGLSHKANATQLTVQNSTGLENIGFYSNADINDSCFGTTEKSDYREKTQSNLFTLVRTDSYIRICTKNALVAKPADPQFCFEGLNKELYSNVILEPGAIWYLKIIPVSAAGGRQLINMQ